MDDLKGKVSIYKPNDFNHYVIKLHLESFLPLIYSYCGYRAGKSN